jgi:hypothetical protein
MLTHRQHVCKSETRASAEIVSLILDVEFFMAIGETAFYAHISTTNCGSRWSHARDNVTPAMPYFIGAAGHGHRHSQRVCVARTVGTAVAETGQNVLKCAEQV